MDGLVRRYGSLEVTGWGGLWDRYRRMRVRYRDRDLRMAQVLEMRNGHMRDVAPELFAEAGAYSQPITANMIDIAARDTSEMIAPMPSLTCSSPGMTSERAKKKADVRTKVVRAIADASDMGTQMYSGADWYLTYGFLPARIEIADGHDVPLVRVLDPVGCYPEYDRFWRLKSMFQRVWLPADQLMELYPEHRQVIAKFATQYTLAPLEVVFYHDEHADIVFLPTGGGHKLSEVANPFKECMIRVARRPGPTSIPRGQYDDVIWVQLAKARFAMLTMEAAQKSVQAPIAVPQDVSNVPLGPDAIIRSSNPESVRRVGLELPSVAFAEQGALDDELRTGARYPQVRTGNPESSVITGRGVQALMGGFDTQVRTAQQVLAPWFEDVMALALRVDEKWWGSTSKTLTGSLDGTPYQLTYKPSRDIDGDWTVDAEYGLMAGLDPNRWLIFGLQARAEKLISRDYLRRQMPAELDAGEEEMKVDVEDLREALKQSIQGYAQAIPALASQGQDPVQVLKVLTSVIEGRSRGIPIERLVDEAFEPPEPEVPEGAEGMVPPGGTPEEMALAQAAGGGGPSPMLGKTGLMPQVAPGQQGMAPGGAADVRTMLAGLTASGAPNMQASVSRREAV